jgi:hypothetical protein
MEIRHIMDDGGTAWDEVEAAAGTGTLAQLFAAENDRVARLTIE